MLVPTVYSLWACPNMLQPLFTYSEVSPKVRFCGCRAHSIQLERLDSGPRHTADPTGRQPGLLSA